VTETAAERHTSSTGRWLYQRRLKIALGIAVLEGILVALEKDFTRWTLIIISAPIIALYLFAGRSLESDTGRQLTWIAAAAQAFAVILTIVALVIGAFVLIIAGVFAAIALILLFGERERDRSKQS
jgi:uncharacterized membrane protein